MERPTHHHVLIIGAGPAGLAIAGRLRHAGIDFHIIEKALHVGDTWRHHYDRLHLHSVKRLSHLPYFPFPDDYPVYVPRASFVEYLEAYAREFNIIPEFNVDVKHVSRRADQIWNVVTSGATYTADHLIVATGVNAIPKRPTWNGTDQFSGSITHSVSYKNATPYAGSRTLVVGMGNTGAELALDLAENNVDTFLSVRSPVNVVPRDLNGRPVQETALILDKIPFGLGEWLGAKIQGVYFGNLTKYGLEKSKMKPAVQLMTTGQTPVIDIGTIAAIKRGEIQVVGEVSALDKNGAVLKSGEHLAVEHVILATGYRSCLSELIERMEEFTDPLGYPKSAIGSGYHQGMYFVGFNNYELGGILGTIFTDSQNVCEAIKSVENRRL